MAAIDNKGKLMPEELTKWVRSQCLHLEKDPMSGKERLFFDNSGGSLRLKPVSEAFQKVDDLPNCGGHGGVTSDYLDTLRGQACEDLSTMFNAKDGCIVTSMTASIIIFDVSEVIIENVPGTNVVTTALEHPSAYDGCAAAAKKFGKELRVAQTDPRTGSIPVENILKLIDQDTCLLSVIMTSNITGAILDIETIVREARKIKPDLYIICDSVQHTPHGTIDMQAAPVDAVNFAPYKFGGIRGLGAGWLTERVMNLPHRKLIQEKQSNWEMGGCAPGMYAGLSAIFSYVLDIGKYYLGENATRRELYLKGMEAIMLHERALLARMLYGSEEQKGLLDMDGVNVAVEMDNLAERDLIVPLTFDGRAPAQVSRMYEQRGVVVHERTDDSLYSARQVNSIGEHGIVRVSPLHCHTYAEIDKFLKITQEIIDEIAAEK
ncbi:MAG: aminotransferase class V-fold PLP-dependent enzyme [Lachnospiraceae bacterium]|uniref:aminotransferase class V-fold PLP-dependent enzyme n=1 Tax=Parablautia sp. Marseille-Q6255 TaxID=3039593 RepID=UPI0024BCF175|nr:aminotransferase class V-fold PLP-dependent enzyme [Parablautia sp. Marseille-Q6255]